MYVEFIQNMWRAVYDNNIPVNEVLQHYFHADYSQCINGVTANREAYAQHIEKQRKIMSIETVEYRHVLEQGDELFALYYPRGHNAENKPIAAEVIAYFSFKEGKTYNIHGCVRLLQGDTTDVDM